MKQNLGQYYDESADFQKAQFNSLIQLIRDNVPCDKVKNLIDIGSGSGGRTFELLDVFPSLTNITAVEPDFEMQSVAREKYNDPRIDYQQMGAEDISSLQGKTPDFDAIFSNWAIHWIEDKEKLMSDLDPMTTNAPYLMISTCERLPEILVDIDQYVRAELLMPSNTVYPWYYLTREEWTALLEKHGWTMLEVKNYTTPHYTRDAREYLEHWFAASTAKFLYGRQMEQISDLSLSDLTWFIEQKYGDPNHEGGLAFDEDVIFMVARKI